MGYALLLALCEFAGGAVYDPTIHAKTMARHVRKADFAKDNSLYDKAILDAVIEEAVRRGTDGFQQIALTRSLLRGKYVYQFNELADALVARHITSNIRRVTSVRQDDRQFIIKCMRLILGEGLPFRIYKFDIASFYESVSLDHIFKQLENDVAFSGQSVRALRTLFIQLDANNVSGLPRGMSMSATLAEYLLRGLDRFLSNSRGVWFYARFVDDIFIITDGYEDPTEFSDLAEQKLPSGLRFNKKSLYCTFPPFAGGSAVVLENSFDFLGYRFQITKPYRDPTDKKIKRNVWLDIAPTKTRKLKTRIAKSLLSFAKDDDFNLLLDRLRLLTSNFNFTDKKTGIRRVSGIYFNYPLLDVAQSTALPDLDRFLVRVLSAPHPKNRLRPANLSKAQRQALLNLRFQDGFMKRRFFSFTPDRLVTITSAWAYA